jgi:hypothetical protein
MVRETFTESTLGLDAIALAPDAGASVVVLGAGAKPLYEDGYFSNSSTRGRTYNAAAKASASASFTFLISSSLAASLALVSRLYQCTSLFFCHRPVGALML